jgi:IS5 family transposase
MSLSALRDELAQVRTKKKEFLAQIERIIPREEWVALIKPCYYEGERGNQRTQERGVRHSQIPNISNPH